MLSGLPVKIRCMCMVFTLKQAAGDLGESQIVPGVICMQF